VKAGGDMGNRFRIELMVDEQNKTTGALAFLMINCGREGSA
jgi:hypothetical protein